MIDCKWNRDIITQDILLMATSLVVWLMIWMILWIPSGTGLKHHERDDNLKHILCLWCGKGQCFLCYGTFSHWISWVFCFPRLVYASLLDVCQLNDLAAKKNIEFQHLDVIVLTLKKDTPPKTNMEGPKIAIFERSYIHFKNHHSWYLC